MTVLSGQSTPGCRLVAVAGARYLVVKVATEELEDRAAGARGGSTGVWLGRILRFGGHGRGRRGHHPGTDREPPQPAAREVRHRRIPDPPCVRRPPLLRRVRALDGGLPGIGDGRLRVARAPPAILRATPGSRPTTRPSTRPARRTGHAESRWPAPGSRSCSARFRSRWRSGWSLPHHANDFGWVAIGTTLTVTVVGVSVRVAGLHHRARPDDGRPISAGGECRSPHRAHFSRCACSPPRRGSRSSPPTSGRSPGFHGGSACRPRSWEPPSSVGSSPSGHPSNGARSGDGRWWCARSRRSCG